MVLFQNVGDKSTDCYGVQSMLHLITQKTGTDQVQKTEEVRLPSRSKHYKFKNVSYPLYLIHVPEIYDLKYKRSIVFTWNLKPHKSLRTKITFLDFKIYRVFGHCLHNASIISIFRNSSKIFTYYGVISQFSICPPDFEIKFQIQMGNVWYVQLNTVFDLISTNIIENYKLEDSKFYKSIHVYHLKLTMTYVATYKIVVEKYQKIVLYTKLPLHTYGMIYNGPGFLAQKTTVKANSQLIVINSFQIIVEFVTNYTENRSNSNRDFLLAYFTQFGDFKNEELSETRMRVSVSFMSILTGTSYIMLLKSPHQSSVNVTIVHYNFQGVYDPICPYGAVSFFEDLNWKNITEIKSLCSSSYEGYLQNVYSSTGRMLVVFYSYKEYSSLNVTVNVSYTSCKSVRIQSCILFETCLQLYKITEQRTKCWEDQKYKLMAIPDKRLKTRYPQMHIFGPVPGVGCTILQMISDPQYSPAGHTHMYHNDRRTPDCSFYLNFITTFFYSVTTLWSFRIVGFFSHSSRFHIVRESQVRVLEKIYEINTQGTISEGDFDYDNCSSNIRNIKPTPRKDITMDLVHFVNVPENLLYFLYFNMWTKDNINPSWLDILVTMETTTSIASKHLVLLNKIPYEFSRVVPNSDQFAVLSFPNLSGNSSLIYLQAVTDQNYSSTYKLLWDREYLVVYWEKVYNIRAKQKRISVALPGAIRKITA